MSYLKQRHDMFGGEPTLFKQVAQFPFVVRIELHPVSFSFEYGPDMNIQKLRMAHSRCPELSQLFNEIHNQVKSIASFRSIDDQLMSEIEEYMRSQITYRRMKSQELNSVIEFLK